MWPNNPCTQISPNDLGTRNSQLCQMELHDVRGGERPIQEQVLLFANTEEQVGPTQTNSRKNTMRT